MPSKVRRAVMLPINYTPMVKSRKTNRIPEKKEKQEK